MLIGHFIFSYVPFKDIANGSIDWYNTLNKNFPLMILAGFLAQLVDGALGMGYGVTSATILLSAGVNLAAISGSIHTAEMFASGASGYSHYKFGNVNKKMFKALVIPGIIGAVLGAVLLSKFGELFTNDSSFSSPTFPAPTNSTLSCSNFRKTGYKRFFSGCVSSILLITCSEIFSFMNDVVIL
jgi:hypothetical protein